MTLLLELQNPASYPAAPPLTDFEQWARAAWLDENDAGVVIRIVDEEESRALNFGFRGKDYPTNVLSFPYEGQLLDLDETVGDGSNKADDADAIEYEIDYLGDLVICLPVIEREAMEQHKHSQQHWAHMVVHGLLHLQGFDHEKEIEADIMEAREVEILRQLGFPDPYELN